jgi:hypothetical protein
VGSLSRRSLALYCVADELSPSIICLGLQIGRQSRFSALWATLRKHLKEMAA